MSPLGPRKPYALEPAFSVKLGTDQVGTFTECSGLAAEYETYSYAEGGTNTYLHTLVGRLHHPNVTLKGGFTDQSVLLDWLLGSFPPATDRKIVTVTFRKPNGSPVQEFRLVQAVPVKWTGPAGNTGANAVATESLEIAHQGVVR
jgi:phage tail-like protein